MIGEYALYDRESKQCISKSRYEAYLIPATGEKQHEHEREAQECSCDMHKSGYEKKERYQRIRTEYHDIPRRGHKCGND